VAIAEPGWYVATAMSQLDLGFSSGERKQDDVSDSELDARKEALLADLNPPQRAAVVHSSGPLLVLAGAGSGKTRALIRKIAWLVNIERMPPWQILAVTFTNKAAAEMRERARHLLGDRSEGLWLGTFHSIGVRLLRQHGHHLGLSRSFVIFDDDDQETMIKRCMRRIDLDEKAYPPRQARAFIDRQKQVCHGPDHVGVPRTKLVDKKMAQVYEVYQRAMKEANAVDFGDLIWLPYRLVTEIPEVREDLRQRFRYILVDEFQDTNRAQLSLLQAMLGPERNICAVGDDDQSIYRWRGAEVENILKFDKEFKGADVIRFEQNYRSTHPILAVSGALIAKNQGRHGKTLFTIQEGGEKVRLYEGPSDSDEAEYVANRIRFLRSNRPLAEFAIIYRTNAQSRTFEDRLRAHGIPHKVYGGLRFYDRAEIKDVCAYLKLIANPTDPVSLERVLNKPNRGIGDTTVAKVEARAKREGISLWDALCAEANESGATGTKLTGFVSLIIELRRFAEGASAFETTREILSRTKFLDYLKRDGSVEGETRAENVLELLNSVSEFCEKKADNSLQAFLDEVALVSNLDQDAEEDAVVLLTAHMAKGLEFDVVFVTGLEEELMPHFNSLEDPNMVEEERRLAYVAMTRARKHLHLTYAESRRRFGQVRPASPSRFLKGLPGEHIDEEGLRNKRRPAASLASAERTWSRPTQGMGPGMGPSVGPSATPARPAWTQRPAPKPKDSAEYADPVVDWENVSQDTTAAKRVGDGWSRGMRTFHPQFGEGVVLGVEGQGDKAKVDVRFWDGTQRKLVARVLTEL